MIARLILQQSRALAQLVDQHRPPIRRFLPQTNILKFVRSRSHLAFCVSFVKDCSSHLLLKRQPKFLLNTCFQAQMKEPQLKYRTPQSGFVGNVTRHY